MALDNKTIITNVLVLSLSLAFFTELFADTNKKAETKAKSVQKKLAKKTSDSTVKDSKPHYPETIDYAKRLDIHEEHRKIRDIHVTGNVVISKNSILNRLSQKIGDVFSVNYTATMIKNLYHLGYFHQVQIYAEPIGEDLVDLHVVLKEKPKLKEVLFVGNKAISEKDLKTELNVEKIPTIEKEELKAYINKIKKYYRKKNYHQVQVKAQLINSEDGRVSIEFTITEGKKSYLNRLSFKGNKSIPSKKLKKAIFSKEDWILGMLDHAGTYNPEMVEGDKAMIEEAYKNNGFINAKVTNAELEQDPNSGHYHITYHIHEGDRYRIKDIQIEGNDVVSEQRLRQILPIQEGQFYAVDNLRTSIENLRMLWGEHGYLFADIEPNIDVHEEDKTVSISFNSDLKDQVYLNRLTIRGNKKTRDKVIRRQILLDEGAMITNQKMELSKACVGLLGYFDPRNGVNWKTTRLDSTHADLDLMLQEVKTGSFSANLKFGGSPTNRQSPDTGLTFSTSFGDKNFMGSGIAIANSIEIAKQYRAFNGSLSNPWMFDRPIRGALNGFIKSSEFADQVDIAEEAPYERAIGGDICLGYVTKLLGGILADSRIHIEKITYPQKISAAKRLGSNDMTIAQLLLDKNFQSGNQVSFIGTLNQDRRNGLAFPTNGYQWNFLAQYTIPGWKQSPLDITDCNACAAGPRQMATFNYFKLEVDTSYYTPLINEHDLVLCLHGRAGIVSPFKCKDIPFRELYHIGGPDSVRGYTYGQVGPQWKGNSLGATKAFYLNVEFIVPITSDLNTRGVIFYDGGAGWDTPYKDEFSQAARNAGLCFEENFENNNFFYRHSVGIGVRLKSPTPLQVDFGIKLNPSKKYRKHLTEMHLNMEHSF